MSLLRIEEQIAEQVEAAAIVSVWSWDEERVLIGEGDNLEIITREELRAEYGDAR